MQFKTYNNHPLHLILACLMPMVFIFNNSTSKKEVDVPQSFSELQQANFPIPANLTPNQQQQLLRDLQNLRRISQNYPVQVYHYQPAKEIQNKFNVCYQQRLKDEICQSFLRDLKQHPIQVNVPSNQRPVAMVLHSDLPVAWQFGKGNKSVKLLFFTGSMSSSIRGSEFHGQPILLASFKDADVSTDFEMSYTTTQLNHLQQFNNDTEYQQQVELSFGRKVDRLRHLSAVQQSADN